MKIKIESDVFDIVKRVKDIDDGYYIIFNLKSQKYELHNYKQLNTYCFSYPFANLDCRFLEMIYATNANNIDNIIEEIDKNNIDIERNRQKRMIDYNKYYLSEIYNFSNNSSKEYCEDKVFSSIWR